MNHNHPGSRKLLLENSVKDSIEVERKVEVVSSGSSGSVVPWITWYCALPGT
jgi:hypothetical protein